MKCVKFLVFIFNFLFWIAGIALIGFGIYVQIQLNKTMIIHNASAASIVLIVVGAVIFIVSFFGCCGAWKENYCMVTTFAILLTLIFLVEIAAGIAAYVFKDRVRDVFDEAFQKSMAKYSADPKVKQSLHDLQQMFKCCGANEMSDWSTVPPFNGTKNVSDSCCINKTTNCGVGQQTNPPSDKIYQDGCVEGLKIWLERNLKIIAGVAIGIAAFEVLGKIFECCLMKGIRSGYEVV